MGKTVLSTLIVKLIGDIKGFEDTNEKARKSAQKMQSDIADGFQSLTGISLSTAGGIAAVGSALKYSIDQAMEGEKVMAATESVLTATGYAAGMTAEEVEKLAGKVSRLSGIDDETVQTGENMLLTFKNIGEQTFPRATAAMADMAVAMAKGNIENIDLNSTAVQLGKALNDPLVGLTALSRVGVTFTAQQKVQIQSMLDMNDVAGAQGVILSELESEFGGMAEAMGGTDLGKLQKAKNSIDNASQAIGEVFLPIIGEAADGVTALLTTAQDIDDVFGEHNQTMLETAESYEEYRTEMIRAAEAAGYTHGRTIKNEEAAEALANRVGILSQAEWEQERAAKAAEAATGPLGEAMQVAIAPAGELALKIGDQETALGIVLGSMQAVTKELLFQKAAQGLDADAALELGRSMGVIDETSYTVLTNLELARERYDENADGLISADEAAQGYIYRIESLAEWLDKVNGTVSTVELQYNERVSLAQNNPYVANQVGGGLTAIPQAEGGDWIVTEPTLFLAGEAGVERATFQPANGDETRNPDNYQFNFNIQSGADLSDAVAEAEAFKRRNR
jgi:hypothetical protein